MSAVIWKRNVSLEKINSFNGENLFSHLGMTFTKIGHDSLEATMPVDHRTKQPFGLLHGGASAALAESLGSFAGYLCTEGDDTIVGLEISASHLRAVKGGIVRGVCKPVRIGRSHQVWEIKIYDEDGQICCIARHTAVVLSRMGNAGA